MNRLITWILVICWKNIVNLYDFHLSNLWKVLLGLG